MDPRGDIAAEKAVREELERVAGPHARKVKTPVTKRFDLPISDVAIAAALVKMPRRARQVFYGSRRNGASEAVSLARAKAAAR